VKQLIVKRAPRKKDAYCVDNFGLYIWNK